MSDETIDFNLPEGWRRTPINEVYSFTQKPRNLNYGQFDFIPFIPMEFVPFDGQVFGSYLKKNSEELTSGTYFEDGDLLVAKITPSFENGKQGIVENLPLPFGMATTEVIPIKEIPECSDKFYLSFYLLNQSVRDYLEGKMEGSTGRQRLSKNILQTLEINFPPLAEQKAIAKVLRSTQEVKEKRQTELRFERERKNALMDYLFSQGIRSESLKKTEIGEIPESWKVVKVGELVEMKYGFQTSIPKTPPPNGVRIISTAEVKNEGRLDLTKIRTVEVPENQVASYCVAQNDILFNWRNSQEHVGKCAIVDYAPSEPTVYASFIIRLRTKPTVDFRFLHALLTNLRNQGLFFKLSRRAVNQANFNANELADVDAVLPSIEEQKEIAEVLQACDEKISALEKEITTLDEFFKAMLEELMSGKLSSKNLME